MNREKLEGRGPHITVVIPCYNMTNTVRAAMRSVHEQGYDNWTLAVVDDGSQDDSWPAILGEAWKGDLVLLKEHEGVAAARNMAIEMAPNGWILPLDADDQLAPGALQTFADYIMTQPDADLFCPWFIRHYETGQEQLVARSYQGYEALLQHNCIHNTSCFRKSAWRKAGGYRDGTKYEDWDLWIRILGHRSKVVIIKEPLMYSLASDNGRNASARLDGDAERLKIYEMNKEKYKLS